LLRNPEAPDIVAQLSHFAAHGIGFHTQVVLVPGVNDGAALERTLQDLYGLGSAVLSVSIVPVALTEYSKHSLVRAITPDDCREALATVDRWATRAVAERGHPWCFGADDLYLLAGAALPAAAWYGDFEQRENGVGAVRYLQTRIAEASGGYGDWAGKRIGIATGTAMAPLMPQVIETLQRETGGGFEVLALENHLFGASVTTAGLLPGAAFLAALRDRRDLDLAVLPAEAVNDDLRFMDDMDAHDLAAAVPMEIRFSYDFADVLSECGMRNDERGIEPGDSVPQEPRPSNSAFDIPHSALGEGP
jgi:NifB/MoaA-like Fe-S oxidoreductase